MKKFITLISTITIILCSGCTAGQSKEDNSINSSTREIYAMDTYMTITAYGENAEKAVNQAEDKINELDNKLSIGKESSEIAILNKNSKEKLSKDSFCLMKRSLELCKQTEGAFNPAIYPIMEAWGFTTKEYKVPDKNELSEILPLTDVSKILYNEEDSTIEFKNKNMKVDFGGIAKGYSSSLIIDIFKENGIKSGLVSLGGNVQVLGYKTDGSLWRVAIQDPDNSESYIGVLETKDKAVITSGGYERYFEENGKKYHHIIDPATGYPSESGLKSVTVVSEDGTMADGLSTALFVMGKDKAVDFWKKADCTFDMILMDKDNRLYITDGISDSFSSEADINIIEREIQQNEKNK